MKFSLTTFCLLLTYLALAQSTRDTLLNYNGRPAKMKMEFDKDGEKIKETVFYGNGKIETIYFYSGNKKAHWIAYDTLGTKTAEWQDPEIENPKQRQTRNVTLTIVSILLISLTWLLWKKFGYMKTYFIIGYTTILITAIQNRIDFEQTSQILIYSFPTVIFCLPVLLLALSLRNLFRKTGISILVSIIFAVFCIWILLVYTMAILTTGAGMLS